jgi:hypothetical protein
MASLSSHDQATSLRLLAGLLAELHKGSELSALSREWLVRGVLQSLRRDEPLDAALGLRPQQGGRDCSPSIRLRRFVRDAWLRRASDLIDPTRTLQPGARAVRLADAIKAFTRFDWGRTKYAGSPPEDWSGYRKALWFAAATDLPLPESANRLGVICKRGGCLQSESDLILAANYCCHISPPS